MAKAYNQQEVFVLFLKPPLEVDFVLGWVEWNVVKYAKIVNNGSQQNIITNEYIQIKLHMLHQTHNNGVVQMWFMYTHQP